MPKEPEPPTPQEPETETTEIETFEIYDQSKNDTRHIFYVRRTIEGRNMFGKKYGETIYIDSTGEEFTATGNKDEYERKSSTGVYKRK